MNMKEIYPSLTYFLRCYLNQDFEVIFGSADEALLAYKNTESTEEQLKMKKEVRTLLDSSLSNIKLQEILLDEIDCSYYYPNEWKSSAEWLKHIFDSLTN